MTRLVKCVKLKQELPGLGHRPFKGPLGERIYQSISQDAWKLWKERSTILLNEYRLNPSEPEAQARLFKELRDFLFSDSPAG